VGLELKRRKMRERPGISFALTEKVREALKKTLPFKPTGAQKRVLGEIAHDMQHPSPMRRLLQETWARARLRPLQAGHQMHQDGQPGNSWRTQQLFLARRILEDVAG